MSQPFDLTSALAQRLDVLGFLNRHRGAFAESLGLVITGITVDSIEAELTITADHLQTYGIVHGGVYASIVESLSSMGAAVYAWPHNQTTVGLENTTSFLHAVRSGVLRARGIPLQRGRRTQVWDVTIRDQEDRVAATGRVRLICLERGAVLAGEAVTTQTRESEGG